MFEVSFLRASGMPVFLMRIIPETGGKVQTEKQNIRTQEHKNSRTQEPKNGKYRNPKQIQNGEISEILDKE